MNFQLATFCQTIWLHTKRRQQWEIVARALAREPIIHSIRSAPNWASAGAMKSTAPTVDLWVQLGKRKGGGFKQWARASASRSTSAARSNVMTREPIESLRRNVLVMSLSVIQSHRAFNGTNRPASDFAARNKLEPREMHSAGFLSPIFWFPFISVITIAFVSVCL